MWSSEIALTCGLRMVLGAGCARLFPIDVDLQGDWAGDFHGHFADGGVFDADCWMVSDQLAG